MTCCPRGSRWRVKPRGGCSTCVPYDVQVMGGAALHFGNIAEMMTGEGKTLASVMPAYLNALERQRRSHRHRQRLSGQA